MNRHLLRLIIAALMHTPLWNKLPRDARASLLAEAEPQLT